MLRVADDARKSRTFFLFLSSDWTSNSKSAFAYGFYIICNIKYEDSESEETCEKCNSRERSLGQIFGLDSKMKGAAIITCSNVSFSSRLREKSYFSVLYTAAAKTIQKSAKKTAKTA